MVAERLIGNALIDTSNSIASTARNLGWNFRTNQSGKAIKKGFIRIPPLAGIDDLEFFDFGVPTTLDQVDGSQVYVFGGEWEATHDGWVRGIRWYRPTNAPGVTTMALMYLKSDQSELARKTFTAGSAGNNQILFDAPVYVTAGTRYVSAVMSDRYAFSSPGGFPFSSSDSLTAPSGVNGRLATTTAGNPVYPGTIHGGGVNFHIGPLYSRSRTFVAGTKWQIWKRASPISSSTLLQSIEIGSGAINSYAGQWVEIPGLAVESINVGEDYFATVYHPSTDPDVYLSKSGFGDPTNGSLSGNSIFKYGSASTVPPDDETFTSGAFGVDIEIDDEGMVSGTVNQVTESGTVFSVSSKKNYNSGLTVETGTVFPVSSKKSREIGIVTEVGTLLPVSSLKSKTLSEITEIGTVFPVSASDFISREIGQVVEFGSPGRLGATPDIDTVVNISIGRTTIEF